MAATPLLSALADPERAYGMTRQVAGNPALPINLELVTVTETSAVLTWFTGDPTRIDGMGRLAPMPADTEVLLGTSPLTLRTVVHDPAPTPYHYVELTDLEPGATYWFVARSGGLPAVPSVSTLGSPLGTSTLDVFPAGPFVFTTPHPPPGRYLFSIALCNDLHLGETVAGLVTTQGGVQIPPGITQVPGEPPYSQVMAAALAPEAHARGAHVLLAAGDISSEAGQVDVAHAKAYLDAFGHHARGLPRGARQPRPPAHRAPGRDLSAGAGGRRVPRLLRRGLLPDGPDLVQPRGLRAADHRPRHVRQDRQRR